jgi:hypothetical protein
MEVKGEEMTDRYYALTVILEKDMRDDDTEKIIEAIKMIKGVLDVKPLISDPTTWMAQERAKRELGEKLWNVLYPK